MRLDATFPERLRGRLARPIPGRWAQRRMAPELSYGRHFGPPPWNARAAAVVVLVYPGQGTWRLPLTVRPWHMQEHAGQVSFPGGMVEPGEAIHQCALRELAEELGVPGTGLEIVGELSPLYVFASNFWVTPCVAIAREAFPFAPNASEVAELLEIPVGALFDPALRGWHSIRRPGLAFRAPHLNWNERRIWGATAMILAEFLQVVFEAAGGTQSVPATTSAADR